MAEIIRTFLPSQGGKDVSQLQQLDLWGALNSWGFKGMLIISNYNANYDMI
jgi:hypothetical protein